MMDYLKSLLKNPIGMLMVIIHWILFLFLFLAFLDAKSNPINPPDFYDFLMPILALDSPAILIAGLIWSPYYFIDMPEVFAKGAMAMSFFTITLQWLIIGKWFSQIIDRRNQKVIENSIFDAN